ncbi:hypothetical protein CsSME_00002566 [Camellia sinensis var. sinensis]
MLQFRSPRLLYYTNSSLRSTSEDTSSGPSQYVEESGVVTVEEVLPVENNSYAEIAPKEVAKEESALDGQVQAFEFLDELDIKNCDKISPLNHPNYSKKIS